MSNRRRTPTQGSIAPQPQQRDRGAGTSHATPGVEYEAHHCLPPMRPRTGPRRAGPAAGEQRAGPQRPARAPRGAAIVLLKRLIMANEFQLAITAS